MRVVTVLKGIYWELVRLMAPEGSVLPRKISGKIVTDVEIKEAGSYTFIYLLVYFY